MIGLNNQIQANHQKNRGFILSNLGTLIWIIVLIALLTVTMSYFYIQSEAKFDFNGKPVKSFVLLTRDFGYNGTSGGPTLNVNYGDVVNITLIGKTSNTHNLLIDEFSFMVGGEFGVETDEVASNRFIADKVGTFTYYCRTSRLGGHESLGEFGVIIVE